MSPGRSPSGKANNSLLSLLWLPLRGRGPLLFSLSIALAVLVFGTIWVWNAVGPRVLDSPEYRLDPREIVINAPPRWITAQQLKQQVIRDASLDPSLSILDDKLCERIALAFAAQPWVARVERVEKFHPARVVVTLSYRAPVAAVAVANDLLPIDREAVLLPREDFSQSDLASLPRIGGIESHPGLCPGNQWQDLRVDGAALIAAALDDCWQDLQLSEIRPSAPAAGYPNSAITYQLITRGGKHISWGRQPLGDDTSEPSAADKLQRLKTYLQQHGTLDGVTLDQDSRTGAPHTASAQQQPHVKR